MAGGMHKRVGQPYGTMAERVAATRCEQPTPVKPTPVGAAQALLGDRLGRPAARGSSWRGGRRADPPTRSPPGMAAASQLSIVVLPACVPPATRMLRPAPTLASRNSAALCGQGAAQLDEVAQSGCLEQEPADVDRHEGKYGGEMQARRLAAGGRVSGSARS